MMDSRSEICLQKYMISSKIHELILLIIIIMLLIRKIGSALET